ncbi:dynactin-associated protein-like [Perognathus longimembris pacificus]|uniref:dynactin-associated protein-like n=1 Tax=Perognathus longimembris pacificus TaxID=214514 RepID=UPI00201962B6|nr:dynactin-associated protein-like [Perognathus longimembris pacificus]
MVGKQQQYTVNLEQSEAELVSVARCCSNEGTHCGCRSHNVIFQPQKAASNRCSLWKTFLVCLLACLVATAITALAFYFGYFGKPISNTTIILHIDGKSSQVTDLTPSTPSPAPPTTSPPESSPPSTPVDNPSSSTPAPATTIEHEAEIEIDDEYF